MRFRNFLIIEAHKSGTTSMNYYRKRPGNYRNFRSSIFNFAAARLTELAGIG